jgi:hypothetical protein
MEYRGAPFELPSALSRVLDRSGLVACGRYIILDGAVTRQLLPRKQLDASVASALDKVSPLGSALPAPLFCKEKAGRCYSSGRA